MLKKRLYRVSQVETKEQAVKLREMLLSHTGIVQVGIDTEQGKVTVKYESMLLKLQALEKIMIGYGAAPWKKESDRFRVTERIRLILTVIVWLLLFVVHYFYRLDSGDGIAVTSMYLVLLLIIHTYLAQTLHKAFLKSLKDNRYSVDSHLAIGMFFLFVQNIYGVLVRSESLYVFYSFGVITLYNFVRYLSERTLYKKLDAIDFLSDRIPAVVSIERKGKRLDVSSADVCVGDIVTVPSGAFFPVDGEIVAGETYVNDNLITGIDEEAQRTAGDAVYQGVKNLGDTVTVRATVSGDKTKIKSIVEVLNQLKNETHYRQHTVDTIVTFYAVTFICIAIFMFIVLSIYDKPIYALLQTGMALTAFCSPALFLVPFALYSVGSTICKRAGIKLHSMSQLDELADVSAVVFDTKGVLTKATHEVVRLYTFENFSEGRMMALACSAIPEGVEDPDFEAILREKEAYQGINTEDEFENVLLGTIEFMEQQGIFVQDVLGVVKKQEVRGRVVMAVALDNRIIGLIVIGDALRLEAKQVTATLNNMNLRPYVVSAEKKEDVYEVTDKLSVGHVIVCRDVPEKCNRIAQIRRLGSVVATVAFTERDMPIIGVSNVGMYFENEMIPENVPGDVLSTAERLTQLPIALKAAQIVRKQTELSVQVISTLSILLLLIAAFGLAVTQTVLIVFGAMQTIFVIIFAMLLMHRKYYFEERN